MNIRCRTLFDCTVTGTTGTFRPSQIPYQDAGGTEIVNQATWNRSRNQQRNWETLLQIMQLRSQIEVVHPATKHSDGWHFVFAVDNDMVYGENLTELRRDAEGVPMITGLNEPEVQDAVLSCSGTSQNIWFETINS
jgi:hypothetical protein